MRYAGDPCPYCKRPLSVEFVVKRDLAKRENAKASTSKRRANGTKGGRKRIRDDKRIWRLRDYGYSIREIAAVVGFSSTAVQRSLKEKATAQQAGAQDDK